MFTKLQELFISIETNNGQEKALNPFRCFSTEQESLACTQSQNLTKKTNIFDTWKQCIYS